ncbi:MAG: helix-turn-helix transcriptional regulator [Gemmatimonadaceae bacterium]
MNPIRMIRDRAGLTQQQLAAVAHTSQATIAAYEGGHKSPTWRTIERVGEAANLALIMHCVPPFTREDRRSLALHQAIAERLRQDPEGVLARARESLSRMHRLHPGARPLLNEWRLFLRRPVDALTAVLLDPSPWGRELRQVTPFTGVLSAEERTRVYQRFARDEASVRGEASMRDEASMRGEGMMARRAS